MTADLPVIPESITVHLGTPSSGAANVTVPFIDYIANVASSEIYPTWPENAIRANIYAQISYALNRVYTEYYPSRGYDFDITNSTSIDQSFVNGRDIFENINQIVGDIFNSYIRRQGSIEPLFAAYCDGNITSCNGLSQWGSVTLAENGLTPYEILQNYYGSDIDIITDVPVAQSGGSAPESPLRENDVGNDVRTLQLRLNRISANYPSIPKIAQPDGFFDASTTEAVTEFQRIFGLTQDGIVGNATWYNVQKIYSGVKRLNELDSEGIALEEVTKQYPELLMPGDTGFGVSNLQYFLNYLSGFYDSIRPITIDGIFGADTEAAVRDLQQTFGLTQDGIVGRETWETMYNAYLGIIETIPIEYTEGLTIPFPGAILRLGSDSEAVRVLQEYLNYISNYYPQITPVTATGYFGTMTRAAVTAFQNEFGMNPSGTVDSVTWDAITDLYDDLYRGAALGEGQYPGYIIS